MKITKWLDYSQKLTWALHIVFSWQGFDDFPENMPVRTLLPSQEFIMHLKRGWSESEETESNRGDDDRKNFLLSRVERIYCQYLMAKLQSANTLSGPTPFAHGFPINFFFLFSRRQSQMCCAPVSKLYFNPVVKSFGERDRKRERETDANLAISVEARGNLFWPRAGQ